MPSKTHRVMLLFLAGGLTSGVVTCMLIKLPTIGAWIMWLGVGAILAIGVGACMLIGRVRAWPLLVPSPGRYLVFLLIAALAYPLNILLMVLGSAWFCRLFRLLAPTAWEHRFLARCQDGDPELGLWFAGIGAAILVSCGLRLMTGVWDRRAMLLLVIGGICTVAALEAYPRLGIIYTILRPYIEDISLLFVLGDTIFCALCGSWLAHAAREVECRQRQSLESLFCP